MAPASSCGAAVGLPRLAGGLAVVRYGADTSDCVRVEIEHDFLHVAPAQPQLLHAMVDDGRLIGQRDAVDEPG